MLPGKSSVKLSNVSSDFQDHSHVLDPLLTSYYIRYHFKLPVKIHFSVTEMSLVWIAAQTFVIPSEVLA